MRKSLLKLPEKIVKKQFIENENMHLCINCFYFLDKNKVQRLPVGLVPDAEPLESGACERLQLQIENNTEIKKYNYHFDSICLKYAKRDLINGNIVYTSAKLARDDETKCGIKAKYFEEK